MTELLRTRLATGKSRRALALLVRLAGAFAVIGTLTGSLVVSCSGDPSSATGGGGSNAPSSASMGQWTPATQDTCTKAFHDSFFVVGPDGKKYPTWHPSQATDPATNQLCSFGHDHGSAPPSGSAQWSNLQHHFAFDANSNGLIDTSELAVSGIPFGLVAEQLVNSTTPRLEDHIGYKIVFANGVPRTPVSGAGQNFTLTCDLFAAYNQPTSTADAFASNLFSVTYAVDCNNGTALAQYAVIVSTMAVYGAPGSFTLDAAGTQQDAGTAVPPNSPPGGTELGRRIPASANVFPGAFVTAGQTSNFNALFERWETQLRLRRADGTEVATLGPAFRVQNPARYYDGGLAFSVNLCYFGLDASNTLVTNPAQAATIVRQVRNNAGCANIAPNGPATPTGTRVAFDDVRSPFNACVRDGFFGADVVHNNTGPTLWYTDAFGGNANTVAFANSIRQFVASADTGTVVLGEVAANQSSCQGTGIHAPN
jgi:hypothetical protein